MMKLRHFKDREDMISYMREVIQRSEFASGNTHADESQSDPYMTLLEALRKVVRAKIADWEAMDELQELLERTATGATVTAEVAEFINQTAANFDAMTIDTICAQELDKLLMLSVSLPFTPGMSVKYHTDRAAISIGKVLSYDPNKETITILDLDDGCTWSGPAHLVERPV